MFGRAYVYGLLFFSLVIGAAGCSTATEESTQNPSGHSERVGRLEAAGTDPGVPSGPTYRTYSDDMRLIKQAARQIPGVRDSTVLLNGPDVYVNLELDDNVGLEESMRIRNQAQASLQRLMPRYNVKVSAGKNGLLPSGPY